MKQMKIRRKKDMFHIEMNFGNTQNINTREADIIMSEPSGNFLRFDVTERKNGFTLIFNADGLLRLPELLGMSLLSKRMLIYILRQFVHIDKKLEDKHFSKELIEFEIENVLIDPATWHIYVMYVPVQPFKANGSLREALSGIIDYASFDPSSDLGYVSEFIGLINNNSSFSRFLIEEFIKRHSENPEDDDVSGRKCAKCGYLLKKEDDACPMCGEPVPNISDIRRKKGQLFSYDDSSAFVEKESIHDLRDAKKISVNEEKNGIITAFKAPEASGSRRAYLVKYETKIPIDKFPFRIGKLSDIVDFCIENGAVSRKHADIIKEQGRYYIVDLASTNGTFLNGRRLQSGLKEEIKSGALLKFANETYMFSIEKEN